MQHGAAERRKRLDRANFVVPGPLWWGFDWKTAETRAGGVIPAQPSSGAKPDPENGVVVLIDEIDKAPPDVPDALLEALGSRKFSPPGHKAVEAVPNGHWSLSRPIIRGRCQTRSSVAALFTTSGFPRRLKELQTWLVKSGTCAFQR